MPETSAAATLRQRIDALGPWFHNLRFGGIQTTLDHLLDVIRSRHPDLRAGARQRP